MPGAQALQLVLCHAWGLPSSAWLSSSYLHCNQQEQSASSSPQGHSPETVPTASVLCIGQNWMATAIHMVFTGKGPIKTQEWRTNPGRADGRFCYSNKLQPFPGDFLHRLVPKQGFPRYSLLSASRVSCPLPSEPITTVATPLAVYHPTLQRGACTQHYLEKVTPKLHLVGSLQLIISGYLYNWSADIAADNN